MGPSPSFSKLGTSPSGPIRRAENDEARCVSYTLSINLFAKEASAFRRGKGYSRLRAVRHVSADSSARRWVRRCSSVFPEARPGSESARESALHLIPQPSLEAVAQRPKKRTPRRFGERQSVGGTDTSETPAARDRGQGATFRERSWSGRPPTPRERYLGDGPPAGVRPGFISCRSQRGNGDARAVSLVLGTEGSREEPFLAEDLDVDRGDDHEAGAVHSSAWPPPQKATCPRAIPSAS